MSDGVCEVIIPVGPGHEEALNSAATSVQMAADCNPGPFSAISIRAYDDTEGKHGRSEARNLAVQASEAEWVYFLDADDMVTADVFMCVHGYTNNYDAIWGKFGEVKDLLIYERYQTWGFETYRQLLSHHPQLTVKIGHFVRREVALKYPFNTEMNAGEDWEYYLRIWKNERCIKLGGPVVYLKTRGNHSQGPKSATGRDWSISVSEQIKAARDEYESR